MIKLNNICKTYHAGGQPIKAADGISLEIADGEMVAVIGASGAGKSTVLKIIGLTEKPESGEYILDGKNVAECSDKLSALLRNEKISFIMQDFALINQFTVMENAELPLLLAKKKMPARLRRKKAEEALSTVGISELKNRKISELSGGQKQRVAVARALVSDADIILADEPTGALDSKTGAGIIELLRSLNEKGTTVMIVTHDMNIAAQCKRVIEIKDGKIADKA